MSTTLGIYIHIPFCKSKCPYCDFNSYPLATVPEERYTSALLKELESRFKDECILTEKVVETIYIGGGTPSVIKSRHVKNILKEISGLFNLADDAEVTIEINPATVDINKLNEYLKCGINRLSIGIQSFSDMTLKTLGRIHNAGDAVNTYEDARRVGFKNIGIDLIFGVPCQNIDMWVSDIEKAISIRPEHISIYGLTIEDGTEFHRMQKMGEITLPDEDSYILMYETAVRRLKEAGYDHYEISNFAIPDYYSRHNMRYWERLDYLGIGAGAHTCLCSENVLLHLPAPHTNPLPLKASHPNGLSAGQTTAKLTRFSSPFASHELVKVSDDGWGQRMWNEKDVSCYMDKIRRYGTAIDGIEKITKGEAISECIFLGLRQVRGIKGKEFYRRFGLFPEEMYHKVINELKTNGMIEAEGDDIRLTARGIAISDTVFSAFFRMN